MTLNTSQNTREKYEGIKRREREKRLRGKIKKTNDEETNRSDEEKTLSC